MEPISVELFSFLAQIPLVGIFVWFSLVLIRTFLGNLERRDEQWQKFFEEQRVSYHEAIASMASRFGDEIRSVGKEVAELRGKMGGKS